MGYLLSVLTGIFVLMKITNKMICPLDDVILIISIVLSVILVFFKNYYRKVLYKLQESNIYIK